MKKFMAGLVAILFFLLLMLPLPEASATARGYRLGMMGQVAPPFTLKALDGGSVSLVAFKGKGLILFFFTTWCPECSKKLPFLVRQYEEYQRHGVEVLLINVGESARKARSLIAKYKVPFRVLLDADSSVAAEYGLVGVPTFFLITKEGSVVYEGTTFPSNYVDLLK